MALSDYLKIWKAQGVSTRTSVPELPKTREHLTQNRGCVGSTLNSREQWRKGACKGAFHQQGSRSPASVLSAALCGMGEPRRTTGRSGGSSNLGIKSTSFSSLGSGEERRFVKNKLLFLFSRILFMKKSSFALLWKLPWRAMLLSPICGFREVDGGDLVLFLL